MAIEDQIWIICIWPDKSNIASELYESFHQKGKLEKLNGENQNIFCIPT